MIDISPGSSLTRRKIYQSIKDGSPQIFNNLRFLSAIITFVIISAICVQDIA